jgi:hypothetical protein
MIQQIAIDRAWIQNQLECVVARMSKLALVAALACSIGLHWAFLQSVAWAGMIAGQHPCKLCRQIAQGKRTEKKPETGFAFKKLEFPYAPVSFVFCAPSSFRELRAGDEASESLSFQPATPPPRTSLA